MSYAVLWSANRESIHAGRLALLPSTLLLEGSTRGDPFRYEIGYDEIVGLGIGRAQSERIRGRPVVVIKKVGGELLRVATLGGVGLLGELVEQVDVARRCAGSGLSCSTPGT